MKHVVMFSGGVASWATAKRVAERHGTDGLTLLFADTASEDEDTYRWLTEAAENVGGELVRLRDGRDIWQVFRDERYLGNTRADPCSRVLKRSTIDRWVREHCDPAETVRYVGFDWTELHRLAGLQAALPEWRVEAPMTEPPYLSKDQMLAWAEREGIATQRLYRLGFNHANCGGGCVKAGVGHFAHLLRVLPAVYATWERNEQGLRDFLGKDVAILRDRSGGEAMPLTLRELRERIETDRAGQLDLFDIGGCGCFVEAES